MLKLRGLPLQEETARRIVNGWKDAFEVAQKDMHNDVVLLHRTQQIELPMRQVSEAEAEAETAKREMARYANNPAQLWNYRWNKSVVDRFEQQQGHPAGAYSMELYVLRLGDVAIATNEFELFADYGIQMRGRSPALQTFIIQLANSAGGYLPTERAVRGGGYSAVIQSGRVGPEGGQKLVDKTLELISELCRIPNN